MVSLNNHSSHATLSAIASGFDQLANLLGVTLGPQQGVVFSLPSGGGTPECLTDSGEIAQKVVELPNRAENVGAMVLRHMAWTVHQEYGDGVATAGVLAQAMVREAVRRIVGGANPMLVRRGMESALAAALRALEDQAAPPAGKNDLIALAISTSSHAALGEMLGEMFERLGPLAAFEIEEYAATYLDCADVAGGRWLARPASRDLMPPGKADLVLENPLVLVVDDPIDAAADLLPVLQGLTRLQNPRPLLIIAHDVTGDARSLLTLNHNQGKVRVAAAALMTISPSKREDFEDIAAMTGAVLLSTATGRGVRHVQPEDLGSVQHAVLSYETLTLTGLTGDPAAVSRRIMALNARLERAEPGSKDADWLLMRIARLSGRVGVLKIGALTLAERAALKDKARKAGRVLQGALRYGVVTGGGAAYIHCENAVAACRSHCALPDETAGVDSVLAALSAPFLRLAAHCGDIHPPVALVALRRAGPDQVLDVCSETIVSRDEVHVVDSLPVVQGALRAAVSAAAAVITTERIVPGRRRQARLSP
jgi:chaperonin GroEL